MSLTEYLDDRLVIFLDVPTQGEAIDVLIDALDGEHKLKEKGVFRKAILDREKIVSAGIGLGVAIPHAKLTGYEEALELLHRNAPDSPLRENHQLSRDPSDRDPSRWSRMKFRDLSRPWDAADDASYLS